MLRLLDVALAAAPLLAGLLLYGVVTRRLPSRRAVTIIVVAELAVAGLLVWQSTANSLRPHEPYVPAQMHGANMVAGHGG